MKKQIKVLDVLKSAGIALALPVAVWIIMEALVFFTQGGHVISTGLDIKNLIRGAGISAAIAFALSMNLTSGRMDPAPWLPAYCRDHRGRRRGCQAGAGRHLGYDLCHRLWPDFRRHRGRFVRHTAYPA